MHNIKFIRENPQEFDQLMFRRGLKSISSKIISIDLINIWEKLDIYDWLNFLLINFIKNNLSISEESLFSIS